MDRERVSNYETSMLHHARVLVLLEILSDYIFSRIISRITYTSFSYLITQNFNRFLEIL